MYRDSYYQKIVELVKEWPRSQNEIHELIGKDNITVQAIAKHLKTAEESGAIIYLGNKVNKKDAKSFLRNYFNVSWPNNAWQTYIYVPETDKFYNKLSSKLKGKLVNPEIIQLYYTIELFSMFQKVEFENKFIIKTNYKSKGQPLTDIQVEEIVTKQNMVTLAFYNSRDKNDLILEFFNFNPLMYWCAFKRIPPLNDPNYNSSKDLVLLKDRLVKEINDLKLQL